jgi:hypothetical protein
MRILLTCMLVTTLSVPIAHSAAAQTAPSLKARCSQLLTYYDWYGASRSENTDGSRNMASIGARVDCDHRRYEQGIAELEDLLRRKQFPVPPSTQLSAVVAPPRTPMEAMGASRPQAR